MKNFKIFFILICIIYIGLVIFASSHIIFNQNILIEMKTYLIGFFTIALLALMNSMAIAVKDK